MQPATSRKLTPQTSAVSPLASLLPSWRRHLRAVILAPRAVQSYLEAAEQFDRFVFEQGMPANVTALRREHVESYIEHPDCALAASDGGRTLQEPSAVVSVARRRGRDCGQPDGPHAAPEGA